MKVRFLPQDITCDIKPNQSVLDVAQENNIFIKSVCGGVPSCAECRVRILDGEYNVLPPSSSELSLIGTAHFVDRRRLSCQLKCFGDITVDLNEQVAKQQVQTTGKLKVRPGQREESIQSHAVKGSILAESRSMLSPQAAPSSGGSTPAPGERSALDRAPKAQSPRQSQPQRAPQQNRPPQQNRAPQPARGPQENRPAQPPRDAQPDGAASAAAGAPGEKREGAARRRRGGRGRNKNRSGGGAAGGGAPTSGGAGPQ